MTGGLQLLGELVLPGSDSLLACLQEVHATMLRGGVERRDEQAAAATDCASPPDQPSACADKQPYIFTKSQVGTRLCAVK